MLWSPVSPQFKKIYVFQPLFIEGSLTESSLAGDHPLTWKQPSTTSLTCWPLSSQGSGHLSWGNEGVASAAFSLSLPRFDPAKDWTFRLQAHLSDLSFISNTHWGNWLMSCMLTWTVSDYTICLSVKMVSVSDYRLQSHKFLVWPGRETDYSLDQSSLVVFHDLSDVTGKEELGTDFWE